MKVDEHGRVDVTGSGAHHESLERGHPHARLDGDPAVDRRYGCPVAEVQHDGLQLG